VSQQPQYALPAILAGTWSGRLAIPPVILPFILQFPMELLIAILLAQENTSCGTDLVPLLAPIHPPAEAHSQQQHTPKTPFWSVNSPVPQANIFIGTALVFQHVQVPSQVSHIWAKICVVILAQAHNTSTGMDLV